MGRQQAMSFCILELRARELSKGAVLQVGGGR